jgi:hypothetical protein
MRGPRKVAESTFKRREPHPGFRSFHRSLQQQRDHVADSRPCDCSIDGRSSSFERSLAGSALQSGVMVRGEENNDVY